MADLIKADEAKIRLKKVPEWELEKKHIERTFEFDDFTDAIDFVNAVAEVAEEEEHHPDIDIRFNKVRLVLTTHSKGGLTDLDFGLAERIDTFSEEFDVDPAVGRGDRHGVARAGGLEIYRLANDTAAPAKQDRHSNGGTVTWDGG
jgi:4a-hydroxytetrahydrobiopterin dehydratase